jgi:hypothetical protein
VLLGLDLVLGRVESADHLEPPCFRHLHPFDEAARVAGRIQQAFGVFKTLMVQGAGARLSHKQFAPAFAAPSSIFRFSLPRNPFESTRTCRAVAFAVLP